MDREDLRRGVAELLDCAPPRIGDDDDLLHLGLDSIAVMRLASRWRAAGAEVTFADLIELRTLEQWWRLVEQRQNHATVAKVPRVDPGAPFELATMQHAYWVGRGDGQPLGGVGAHFYIELDGRQVDPARLERAVRRVIARHPMLRAEFLTDGTQRIRPDDPWPGLRVHDLREVPAHRRAAHLERVRDQMSRRRMDVATAQTFDVALSLLPDGQTRVHLQTEMLVADAHSFRQIMSDLAAGYADPAREPAPIGLTFAEYLAAARRHPGTARDAARDYWRRRLDSLPGAPELPVATPASTVSGHRTTRHDRRLDQAQHDVLRARARDNDITLPVVFLTAFAYVIGAWSANQRFLLNLPLYDRRPVHPDVNRVVGDFTNLVLLEAQASAGSFAAQAKDLQQRLRADVAQSAYTGIEVLRDIARSRGGTPIGTQVVFTSTIGLGELFDAAVCGCFGAPGYTISQTPQVAIDCQVTERAGGIHLNWDVVEEIFPPGVCADMFAAYGEVVDWLLAEGDWDRPLPEVLDKETRRVRAAANATTVPRRNRLLHQDFFELAGTQPDRPAVISGSSTVLTYRELAERAAATADELARRGMRPGDTVAITVPKGPDQVVAVLGVLLGGGTYVPIGVDMPPVRRDLIAKRADARLTITEADLPRQCVPVPQRPWPGDPARPAYVLFTSGSTGEPKGVVVPHSAAVNTIDDLIRRFTIGPADRLLVVSALDFDLSVFDMFAPLSVGGALVTITEETRRDPHDWVRQIRRHRVTVWQSVPALLDMLLTAAEAERDELPLRLALLGGDWVGPGLAPRLMVQAGARLVALGGTTETAIHSTVQPVPVPVPREWPSIPYGRPLGNQLLRVVDDCDRDRPDWVPGELWIGGDSVALGYRGDPERTAARFVTHAGRRWYRTGDRARYWPDGTVEFLGRCDFQLKIRGHRIEPGEIEALLEGDPQVARAVAFAVGDRDTQRLVAAVAANGSPPDPRRLTALVADTLPPYFVPSVIRVLDELPLTANGKIDRRRLARLVDAEDVPGAEPPAGDVERTVASLWSQLLGVTDVARQDSFFTLGGDSLSATRLLAKLRVAGLGGVRISDLFQAPTLREFSARLGPVEAAEPAPAVTPDPEHRYDPFPPTDVQRAYWIGRTDEFALGGVGSHWYWEFDGSDVDIARLESAVNRLIARHEMLRAVFDEDGNQRILAEVPRFEIPVRDGDAGLETMRETLSRRVPDPGRWPLLEIHAVRHADNRTRIAFSFDYIVLDALSIVIFFAELSTVYREPDAELPPLRLSFRDYVVSTARRGPEFEEAAAYWRARLDTIAPAPPLPRERDPASLAKPAFRRRARFLPPEQWRRITDTARAHQLTPASVLATAFAEVLGAFSGADRLSLNVTMFHREDVHPDINAILGDFTSLLIVGHEAKSGEPWLDTARRLQTDMWAGMQHGAVSALWVLRELARRRQTDTVSLPIVFTSALGIASDLVDLRFPFGSLIWGISQTPQVWLDNQVMERDGGLYVNWDSVDELFPDGLLDAMFDAYDRLLLWLADGDWSRTLPDLLPPEQRRTRARVNATEATTPWRTLHDPIFGRESGRPAVIHGDQRLAYPDLVAQALRVAGTLAQRGIGPGDTVAVSVPRGPDQIATVLGVLAAGAAYVPIGVDQPAVRRRRICAKSGVRAVIGEDVSPRPDGPGLPAPVPTDPGSLAYVIFTSGSTGEPKGVEITHAAAVNTVDDINGRYRVGPADRVLAVSALDFDLSVYDIFGLLSAGGAVVLIDDADRREARLWAKLVREHRVTVWNSVPALLDMLLTAGTGGALGSLRLALASGDWVGVDLPGRLSLAAPGVRFVALGGATEASIWSNACEVTEVGAGWTAIPYGFPLRNQRYRVVDGRGRDCPDWVPGELWIGGAGVALGYRGEPELTARRFGVDAAGMRWYRTGDQGRYWPDGTLEFLGRLDAQVKIRGHRIELGEIEAAARCHDGVSRAIAVTTGDRDSARLGLAVLDPAGGVRVDELRATLAERLPAYMVPAHIVAVDRIPMSANGKVDRAAVRGRFDAAGAPDQDEPPAGATEAAIAALWAELLGNDNVGRHRSFFALGGDSLLATRLLEAMRRRLGVVMTLRQLFAAPTVAQLASVIRAPADVEEGVI